MKRLAILLVCAFGFGNSLLAQESQYSPIIFIYDASGSMWGQMQGKTKMVIASEVLSTSVNKLPANQNVGLVAYGHRKKGDCKDVEFLLDMTNTSKSKVVSELKNIKPLGKTPLAYSARLVIDRLRTSKEKATIILITDGIESCDGNICDLVQDAKKEGIDFKLHIVGFGLKDGETEQLKCAAKAGDGHYYDAADSSGLGEALEEVVTKTVDDAPGNFSIYATKNGEPVDAWIKAVKAGTNNEVDGARTYRDTSFISLPPGKYDIIVKPLENTRIKGTTITVESIEGVIGHRTVSFDGGKINLSTLNNNEGWDCTSKVLTKSGEVVGGSRTYGRDKLIEVNAGIYDIEISALVMKGLETTHIFKDVIIEPGKITNITHNFKTGKAMLGVKSGNSLIDATINLKEKKSGTWVAGGRSYTSASSNPREYILNPGVYEVVVKAVNKEFAGKDQIYTIEVKQGETVEKISKF